MGKRKTTKAEKILFWYLTKWGHAFETEYKVDKCHVDFYLPAHNLMIELDGWYHRDIAGKDFNRDEFLKSQGKLLRLKNKDVLYGNAARAKTMIEMAINDANWNKKRYHHEMMVYKLR